MGRSNNNIVGFLREVELALENTRGTPEIVELLASHGYGDQRLLEGASLYEQAWALTQQRQQGWAEKLGAGRAQQESAQRAGQLYQTHLAIARRIFADNPQARAALGLGRRGSWRLADWLARARQFYGALQGNPALLERMVTSGLAAESFEHGRVLVEQRADANERHLREHGQAQLTTTQRDAALEQLRGWFSTFVRVARLALREHPGHLAKLGL